MWYLFWHYLIGSRQSKFMHDLFGFSLMFPSQKPKITWHISPFCEWRNDLHQSVAWVICDLLLTPGDLRNYTNDRKNRKLTSWGFGSFSSLYMDKVLYDVPGGLFGISSTNCTTKFTKSSLFCLVMCHLSPCRWKEPQEGVEHVGNKNGWKNHWFIASAWAMGRLTWRDLYWCSPS